MLRLVKLLLTSLVVTLLVAVVLVATQRPTGMSGASGLDLADPRATAAAEPAPLQNIPLRDGYPLQVRMYGGADNVPLLVLLHGSGLSGLQFDQLANELSDRADVIVPDLRGHGTAPGRGGDVDYIGQLEDDVADMIAAVAKPGQPVVMGGHSMGGGLVVRFAGGEHGGLLDGAILLAPVLAHDAPIMRDNAGGWADVLTRRIIGLDILNAFGITALNHLPVVRFNTPPSGLNGLLGDTVTTGYSYRLDASIAARGDTLADVAALPPFVLMAGSTDEVVISSQFAPTMGAVTDRGRFDMLLGASHLGIVDDPRTLGIIEGFLDGY